MTPTKIIVIGAGAAGMISAGFAGYYGAQVTIFEKNNRVGRKIMITGKGRCNVTNNCDVNTFISNVPTNGRFLYSAINTFTTDDTISFFEDRGVQLKTERGNRVFPVSDKAVDIVDCLNSFINDNNVTIVNDDVKYFIIEDNKVKGVNTESGKKYYCDKVIVATGGKSYPLTGSTGAGYNFARQAGHTVVTPKPSLVPITSPDTTCKDLQGLSLRNVSLSVIDKNSNKELYSDFGEMLFTHFGVSGPIILSSSAHIRGKNITDYYLSIDLKPALTDKQLDARILRDFEMFINRDIQNSLNKLLPNKIIPVVLQKAEIPFDTKCNSITKEQRNSLVNTIKHFTVNINGFRPIEEAIVTSGGVCTKEINPKTMESKLCSGLYFAGEVIDVDAYTGGFNLQIAFSTGYLAGVSSACDY